MKLTNLGLISASCLALSCSSNNKQVILAQHQKPNVVIFFTDDNAFNYWGFSGGPKLSPNIDKLAAEGMSCTQFYSCSSVCTPSRFTLQTGKYAGRCTNESFLKENPYTNPYRITWNTYLDSDKETTVGDAFKKGGYTTGFVGKWHLGQNNGAKYNFKPDDDPANSDVDKKLKAYQQDIVNEVKSNGYDYAASITPFNNDWHTVKAVNVHNLEWYAKGSIDFLNQYGKQKNPFFLIVNITTHHGPCHIASLNADVRMTQAGYVDGLEGIMPPRESVFQRIKDKNYPVNFQTTGSVWTDDCVGSVINHLKELGLYDNTMIIFTTDHNKGENGKASCYNAGNHIPCVINYPHALPAGSRFNEQFQMVDIFPTVLDACDITLDKNDKIDGISMWPYMKEEKFNLQRPLYFEFGYSRAIIDGDWKYIAIRFPDELVNEMKTGKTMNMAFNVQGKLGSADFPILKYQNYFVPDQLYYLKNDPGEQINLAYDKNYCEKLNEMKGKLGRITSSFKHPFPIQKDIDPFFFTDKYRAMCENVRENMGFKESYWYSNDCY